MTRDLVPLDDAPRTRSPLTAGGRPAAIVPQSLGECLKIAEVVCAAGMAPPGLDAPEKAMVAIMHGLEIGLTPMAALQRIAVVNGRPTIWGDGALSLVRASGLCVSVDEVIEGQGDQRIAVCTAQRKGETKPIRRTFSVVDAKIAGLWDEREKVRRKGKNGEWYEKDNDAPWRRYPERMLAMRARAFCLRDGFADVLGGLYLKEELDNGDEREEAPQQRRAPSPSPAPQQIEHKPETPPATQRAQESTQQVASQPRQQASAPAEPQQQPEAAKPVSRLARGDQPPTERYDPEKVRKAFAAAASAANNRDDLNAAWDTHVDRWGDDTILKPDKEDLDRIYGEHASRLDEAGR